MKYVTKSTEPRFYWETDSCSVSQETPHVTDHKTNHRVYEVLQMCWPLRFNTQENYLINKTIRKKKISPQQAIFRVQQTHSILTTEKSQPTSGKV